MAKFYTGDALRAKIREVMEGNKPRISVAFLGVNWARELFGGAAPKNLKILCDIAMGFTPRPALEAAGHQITRTCDTCQASRCTAKSTCQMRVP